MIISSKKKLQDISQLNWNKHAPLAHVMIKDVHAEDISNIQTTNLCIGQPAMTTIVSHIILWKIFIQVPENLDNQIGTQIYQQHNEIIT